RRLGTAHSSTPIITTAATSGMTLGPCAVPRLDAQFFTGHGALAQLLRRAREDDHALLHDVAAVAHAQRDARVLLDEQYRYTLALQLGDDVADVAHERRRQAL